MEDCGIMELWNCGIAELREWANSLPISSFGNNSNNFFLAPRNHAARDDTNVHRSIEPVLLKEFSMTLFVALLYHKRGLLSQLSARALSSIDLSKRNGIAPTSMTPSAV